jgi:hypothetical protein
VDDSRLVREAEPGADLLQVGQLVGQRQVAPLLDDVGEGIALDVLHRDVGLVIVLAAGIDGDDVRVTQGSGRARFAEEAVEDLLVVDLLSDHLDRDLAVELGITPQVHGAHPPGANLPEDLEIADFRGDVRHYGLRPCPSIVISRRGRLRPPPSSRCRVRPARLPPR